MLGLSLSDGPLLVLAVAQARAVIPAPLSPTPSPQLPALSAGVRSPPSGPTLPLQLWLALLEKLLTPLPGSLASPCLNPYPLLLPGPRALQLACDWAEPAAPSLALLLKLPLPCRLSISRHAGALFRSLSLRLFATPLLLWRRSAATRASPALTPPTARPAGRLPQPLPAEGDEIEGGNDGK